MPLRMKLEQTKEALINDRHPPLSSRIGKDAPGGKATCGRTCMARNGDRFALMHLIFSKAVLSEVWEVLHWRFLEELKEILRLLKEEAGRETMLLQDIKFFALLPNEHGQAWLELPRTFDLLNPEGWFATEVVPRIERRQERMVWRMTWEGARRGDKGPGARGEADSEELLGSSPVSGRTQPGENPSTCGQKWRVALLTHLGRQNQACQRSHAGLQGRFSQLDPCVQMQLLRRGGLKGLKMETKESVKGARRSSSGRCLRS